MTLVKAFTRNKEEDNLIAIAEEINQYAADNKLEIVHFTQNTWGAYDGVLVLFSTL